MPDDVTAQSRELRQLLASHDLSRLGPLFSEHGIDLDILPQLSEADLKEIGVSLGDRKRVALMQQALQDKGPAPAPQPQAEPVRRQITVLFADLVGSIPLSVQLDPEDLRTVIQAYHSVVEETALAYGGYVAQHLGDGAVVYFGWPTAHGDDAERAVRSGLDLVEKMPALRTLSPTPLATRVGIATGRVVVGDLLENPESRERPVIGETPNLAARLEGLAPAGGLVISDTTRRMVGDLFQLADLGPQQLKGFESPVRAWRVEGLSSVPSRFLALRGQDLSPLVGRDVETGILSDAWQAAVDGRGRVVHLVGDAGIGKSRLVRWMRDRVSESGGSEQMLFCSPYHVGSAFHPLIRQLEASADIRADDKELSPWSKLERLAGREGLSPQSELPVLAKLLQVPVPPEIAPPKLEPIQEKEILLGAAVTRLKTAAEKGPVLLVVEDLHWIDPSSNELLERMMAVIAGLPVLMLLSYRPDYKPTWAVEGHVILSLGRLAPENSREIVASLLAGVDVEEELVRRIVARTDGVPLFVEELTKNLLEVGLEDLSMVEDGSGDALDQAIPETLEDSLLARLDRLGYVKHVAHVAACIGREFSRVLVHRVSGLDPAELDDALDRLLRSGLVQVEGGAGELTYVFKHALVQEAAYQSLLRSTRVAIHSKIASALEGEVGEVGPEILAYHYGRAGNWAKRVDYCLLAGQRALSTTAFLEAIQHFSAGLRALERLPEPDPRRELALRVHLAVPLTLTRGWAAEEVGAAYRRAHELCQLLGEPPDTFPTLVGIFTYHLVRGEFDLAYELGLSNEAVARESGDPELIIEATHDRGTSSFYMGRFQEAIPHLEEAASLYNPAQHTHHAVLYNKLPGPTALNHLILAQAVMGRPEAALEGLRRAAIWAEEGEHAFTRVWVKTCGCIVHLHLRDLESLTRDADIMIEESRELGFPNWLAQGLAWAGWARAVSGDPEAGVGMIRQGLDIWTMTGAELMKPYLNLVLVDALLMMGELSAAEETYRALVSLMSRTGEQWCCPEVHRLGGEVARRTLGAEHEETQRRFALSFSRAREMEAHLYELNTAVSLARLHLDAGRVETARNTLLPALQQVEGRQAPVFDSARELLAEVSQ